MNHQENAEAVDRVFARFRDELGADCARKALQILFEELGGLRLTFPSLKEQFRKERDERIRMIFNKGGITYYELAVRFELCENQIRNIVHGERLKLL